MRKKEIVIFRTQRVKLIDALKGFGLVGILILNYVQHFFYPYAPVAANYSDTFWLIDKYVYALIVAVFELKVIGFFALIFGISFYHQYSKQKAKNRSFWQIYTWRLYILSAIGLILVMLLPSGGGLLLLSCLGLFLSLVRRYSRQTILIIAFICFLQPLMWAQYLLSLFVPSFTPLVGREAEMYTQIAANATSTDLLSYFYANFVYGLRASIGVLLASGLLTLTISIMLFGYWLGRKNLLNSSGYKRNWWIRCLLISITSVIAFGLITYYLKNQTSGTMLMGMLGTVFSNWTDVAILMVLVAGFVLFFKSERHPKMYSIFRIYGCMSLTNYILQSVIGMVLFLPVGFFLAKTCGTLLSLLIAGVVFTLLLMFSTWWQQRFTRGPIEYLVHKLTWL